MEMKVKTIEALETYINGNISDARKYFKKHQSEIPGVVEYYNGQGLKADGVRFLRLMLGGN